MCPGRKNPQADVSVITHTMQPEPFHSEKPKSLFPHSKKKTKRKQPSHTRIQALSGTCESRPGPAAFFFWFFLYFLGTNHERRRRYNGFSGLNTTRRFVLCSGAYCWVRNMSAVLHNGTERKEKGKTENMLCSKL